MKTCPACAEEVQDAAKLCKHCHYAFDASMAIPWQAPYSRAVAGFLAIVFWGLGAHKFYLGQAGQGILYLVFCWTLIPSIIGLFEGMYYLSYPNNNAFSERMQKKGANKDEDKKDEKTLFGLKIGAHSPIVIAIVLFICYSMYKFIIAVTTGH